LIITLLVIGAANTLPIYIFTQVKHGITPDVNPLASMLFCAPVLLTGLAVLTRSVFARLSRRTARPLILSGDGR
jgi:spermidine/putrescine transport system permease protein